MGSIRRNLPKILPVFVSQVNPLRSMNSFFIERGLRQKENQDAHISSTSLKKLFEPSHLIMGRFVYLKR